MMVANTEHPTRLLNNTVECVDIHSIAEQTSLLAYKQLSDLLAKETHVCGENAHEVLATALNVPPENVLDWMEGMTLPRTEVFPRLVRFLASAKRLHGGNDKVSPAWVLLSLSVAFANTVRTLANEA